MKHNLNKGLYKKGFTLLELVIVIGIIAIISAVLMPTLVHTYNKQKDNIIDIYNGSQVVCMFEDSILYQGEKDNIPNFQEEGYVLVDTRYTGGTVFLTYEKKIQTEH